MDKAEVIAGVSKEIVWWMGERHKKLVQLKHETMSVNPFLLPLIFGIHEFTTFEDLSEFLVAAHLSTGYATGFGKLIDEKILPRVFGTIKLDKNARKVQPLTMSAFNEIDHIIPAANGLSAKLLSLKAGKWTIQLTMAMHLNTAFKELIELRDSDKLGDLVFDEIVVGVFYGTKEGLTDKYDILRGINRGAQHNVHDVTKTVNAYAGREFWSWLNQGQEETQHWVLDGMIQGFEAAQKSMGIFSELLAGFRKEFGGQFRSCIRPDHSIDWHSIIRNING